MKRKAFTLVEMLIVLVVLGILAAGIMYASDEAITTAKATKIISDLQLLSKAAESWYLDNYQRLKPADNGNILNGFKIEGEEFHHYIHEHPEEVTKYIDRANFKINQTQANRDKGIYASAGEYALYMGHSNIVCYAVYGIPASETKLKQKLKARAQSAGLKSYKYGGIQKITYEDGSTKEKSASTGTPYNGTDTSVFMVAFTLLDPEENYKPVN